MVNRYECDQKITNRWTARFIPLLLIGIVSYASWVIVALVCIQYLLQPPRQSPHGPRHGAAIAILVIYFPLLLLMALSYFRILQTIITNPGYVPRGPQLYQQQCDQGKNGRQSDRVKRSFTVASATSQEKFTSGTGLQQDLESGRAAGQYKADSNKPSDQQSSDSQSQGLEYFYTKDVFVCGSDGRPPWCSTCLNWKPDRAHHCREVGRCVKKMDHFCPWVGGIISETSFKFFVQFVSWGLVYCLSAIIFMSIFINEKRDRGEQPSVHWILTLAFASLFALMALGMAGSSIQLAAINSTTVENLSRKVKVWQLAVFIPQPHQGQLGENPATSNGSATTPTTITYPLTTPNPNHDRTLPSITLSGQSSLSTITQKPQPPRTFAILSTPPGANPWDLGTLENLKSVLGNHWYDWLLPLRHSPCCYHDGGESAFQLGGIVNRLRKETGISSTDQISRPSSRRRQRRSTTAMADGSERSQRHGHRSSIRKEEVRRKRKRKRRVRLEAEEPGGAVIR